MKDWVGILSDWPCSGDTKQIGDLGLLGSVECFALLYKLSRRLSPHLLSLWRDGHNQAFKTLGFLCYIDPHPLWKKW